MSTARRQPANIINYATVGFNFHVREKFHPGYFSEYKKFFRGTKWHVFLAPAADLGSALAAAKARGVNDDLWPVPGVYEYAVAKSPSATRHKTYVGTTVSIRDRHGAYARNGDHIAHFMEAAVRSGLFVMRRIRYIIPRPELDSRDSNLAGVVAEQTETRFLGKYNYAWNSRQNGNVAMTREAVKTSFLCLFSRIKFVRHPDAAEKFARR